ncbi:MAG: DsbA family protein, partial [Myxococcales bacterium]|nr:DsbA family protein [Myxococcales bacterium]
MKMNPIPVKLYSDFICPYCFIGERVIEQLSAKFPIDIEWTGYEIHPEIPYGGMSLHSFGGDFMDGLWQRIAPLAESYGVKREGFLEEYQGSELDPNWVKRIANLSAKGWKEFTRNEKKTIKDIRSEIQNLAQETAISIAEFRRIVN